MHKSVFSLLEENNIYYEQVQNNPAEIKIKCISGLHEDNNPSMSINLEKEVFNCFSCSYAGSLSKLFKDLGVTNYQGQDSGTKQGLKLQKLKNKLNSLRDVEEVRLPEPNSLIAYNFKGIRKETLRKFNVFTTDSFELQEYVCVPVYQHGKLKFIEGRYKVVDNRDAIKYLRKPNGVSVNDVLYPFDSIKDFSTIILVEGSFDLLNLHDLGYTNSLCIFGTKNFTNAKLRLLDDYGCRHVILMMDSDVSGTLATKKITAMLDKASIRTTIVTLPKDRDPGDLSQEEADYYLSNLL